MLSCSFCPSVYEKNQDYLVLNEVDLMYDGKPLHFVWKGYGIELYCEADALPHDVNFKISAITSSDGFNFPIGFELVSEAYRIDCPYSFKKPVTLKIRHNIAKTNDKELYFAFSSDKTLPYNFYCKEGGQFDEHYGIIETSSFCIIGLIRKVVRLLSGPSYYSVSLYSNDGDPSRPSDTWNLYIFVVERGDLEERVKRYVEGLQLHLRKCVSVPVELCDNASEIKFKYEGRVNCHKISLFKKFSLKKEQIVTYSNGTPPQCKLQLTISDCNEETEIIIFMEGIKDEETYIAFVLPKQSRK